MATPPVTIACATARDFPRLELWRRLDRASNGEWRDWIATTTLVCSGLGWRLLFARSSRLHGPRQDGFSIAAAVTEPALLLDGSDRWKQKREIRRDHDRGF
jgi:hypothetical protein